MKRAIFLLTAAAASAALAEIGPRSYYGHVARRLGDMLPKYHVLHQALGNEISQRAWTNLVTFYDFDHSVFLQSDLDRFARHEVRIDDEIKGADVSFGFEVYNLYVERLKERVDFATNLLARGEWDFTVDETYRIKRKDAPWPRTREEAEDHWRRRMKNEVLAAKINADLDKEDAAGRKGHGDQTNGVDKVASTNAAPEKADAPEEVLIKKYRQYVAFMTEPDEEAVLQHYLSAVCRAYDPHTDYMSPDVKDDFDMEMNLSLYGIGATLSMEDGMLKIVDIVPGSPCERDGRLKEGDRIVGVQQDGGPMEDVMWQPLKKSVKKIRGPKGTKVTLQVVPKSDSTGTSRKLIDLIRDEIKLEEYAATGHVERVTLDGLSASLGYVYLPGFYGTMNKRSNEEGFRSCSMDVAMYLADFNAQGAQGLVLDLRGNGGGALVEAVKLSALFVQTGPVVQIRDIRSVSAYQIPPGGALAFKKPIVVLIDRASASASEIVAGHLQDTGRAVVIGDARSHGKGTVQTVLGMGPQQYGSCKITTARFYRIDGRSTQLEGISSDIHLPSLLDSLDIGEDKLTYSLPFSRILPADYDMAWNLNQYVPVLRERSEKRTQQDPRFVRHLENVRGMKELGDREFVSLEYSARKLQMRRDRDLRELDDEESEDDDEETAAKKRRRKRNEKKNDIVLEEAYRVMMDLIRLTGGESAPEMKGWW